jgi:transposase
LACTLPKDFGKPLSRWSSPDLAKLAIEKGIVSSISPSTIREWLREEKIKPWQHRSWQKPTDPLFLERATVVLNLYEQAQELATRREFIVCADEKTCIQALRVTGGIIAAGPGKTLKRGCRYKRLGIANLFAGLLVHTGETIARFFERKRFVDFQDFLNMIFYSLWTKDIRVLHLILDNGPTHAPKQIEAWITSLRLPFEVRVHWLPKNSSWLDQVEIVFSPLQRKVLTPRHFDHIDEMKDKIMGYLAERNRSPKPIRWSYTAAKLREQFSRHAASSVPS